jgi:Holliday junction resolvase-like predicted endonuclease
MKASEGKHDRLVGLVEDILHAKKYDVVGTLTKFKVNGRDGEMDLFAIKDNYALVFEVKCSNNYKTRKKAKEQLSKDEQLFKAYRVFKFMVYYKHGGPEYLWIRN